MGTAGLAILASTLLSILAGTEVGPLGITLKIAALAASLVINICAYVFAFRIACAGRLSIRDVAPGAIAAAVIWQLLQSFGIVYVGHVVQHASATNGLFALVLGLVAFLYLSASAVVLCIEVNVVRVGRLHPRALLTPFTDKVQLTSADQRAYTRQAEAQRGKGFQRVEVSFDEPHRRPRRRRTRTQDRRSRASALDQVGWQPGLGEVRMPGGHRPRCPPCPLYPPCPSAGHQLSQTRTAAAP